MEIIGFQEKGCYFINPETELLVEFPDGPLSVGEEPVKEISEFEMATGTLQVISATDCVKDRLCAFIFGMFGKAWHRLSWWQKVKKWI
jgi:hypothetical protein